MTEDHITVLVVTYYASEASIASEKAVSRMRVHTEKKSVCSVCVERLDSARLPTCGDIRNTPSTRQQSSHFTGQEIGWEERLQSVGWGVKPWFNQSINMATEDHITVLTVVLT